MAVLGMKAYSVWGLGQFPLVMIFPFHPIEIIKAKRGLLAVLGMKGYSVVIFPFHPVEII